MIQYGWTPVTVNLTVGAAYSFFLPGNPRRISLVINSANSAQIQLATGAQPAGTLGWISLSTVLPAIIHYRDIGPLVQAPVYAITMFGNGNATITEIFKL